MTQRSVPEVIQWYKEHTAYPASLSYNPNGMCLRICRDARNIGPMWPSALAAQLNTPKEHRIRDVADVRKGHVAFFDNADDSNPYGHIVTVIGRDKNRDPNSLSSLLVRTNSVKDKRIVVVRGDYFQRFWNDPFQFAADYLNGVVLDMPDQKPKKVPGLPPAGERRVRHMIEVLDDMIAAQEKAGRTRLVKALKRDREELRQTLRKFRRKS